MELVGRRVTLCTARRTAQLGRCSGLEAFQLPLVRKSLHPAQSIWQTLSEAPGGGKHLGSAWCKTRLLEAGTPPHFCMCRLSNIPGGHCRTDQGRRKLPAQNRLCYCCCSCGDTMHHVRCEAVRHCLSAHSKHHVCTCSRVWSSISKIWSTRRHQGTSRVLSTSQTNLPSSHTA